MISLILAASLAPIMNPQKYIKAQINKARGAFSWLRTLWKSKQLSLRTKTKLYKSRS